jgi:hypothetical protein
MTARTFAALAIATGLLTFLADGAQAADALAPFAGSWSGGGTITVQDGSRERIRCRSSNTAGGGGLNLGLRCASDSYKFEIASDLTSEGSNVSGSWNENTRGVFGQLAGRVSGGRIQATASAIGFSATLLIATHSNSLSVLIKSPGSEISEVSISMAKAGSKPAP